jgi:hypothetical protein
MREVDKGGADRHRDLPHLSLIAVRAACPGEVAAEEAIVVATRHDVNMEVRHTLADDIVDRHERAFATGRSGYGARQAPRQGEERSHLADGQIGKGPDMRSRREQHMAGEQRAAIEKCDPRWIVEDDLGGGIAADYCAEDTRAAAGAVTRVQLDVEDHGDRTPLSHEWLFASRRNR